MRVAIVEEPDPEIERIAREVTISDTVPEPLLLTGNDIAKLLRIGRSKAFSMMAKGELPVVRFGRSVRVPRNALDGWIESMTMRGDPILKGLGAVARKYRESGWQ